MQFKFFRSLFYKLSSLIDTLQKTFENEEKISSKNPLYQSFNLYVQEDLKIALNLIKSGYVPTRIQKENLHKSLNNEAIKNVNFIPKYSEFHDLIPQQAFINYCIHHDLSIQCNNQKTIFANFEYIFKKLSQQEKFSELLHQELKTSISNLSSKATAILPKYEHIHAFDFNKEDYLMYSRLTGNIYNSLVLIPYTVRTMDQFVSLRSIIEQSVEKIKNHVQSHNVRIIDHKRKVIHYNQKNRQLFKIDLLSDWVEFIQKYDTKTLEQNLLNQIQPKELTTRENKNDTNVKSEYNRNNLEDKINQIKTHLTSVQQEQISRIQELYILIHSDMFEKKQHYELENLYKDLPNVIEKFISIHPEYRNTLKNIEGKSPEQLMEDSLNTIENKFKEYWENINQNKVTDLSIVQRAIKMKA